MKDYIEEIDFKGIKNIKRRCIECHSTWYIGAIEWHNIDCSIQTNQREPDNDNKPIKEGRTCPLDLNQKNKTQTPQNNQEPPKL